MSFSQPSHSDYISPFNPYHSTFVQQQERRPTYDEYIRKGSTASVAPEPRPSLSHASNTRPPLPRKASISSITRPQHTSIIRLSAILDPQDLLSLTADQVRSRKTIYARQRHSRTSMHRKSIRRNGLPSRPDTFIRANKRLPSLVRTPGGSVVPAHAYVARQSRPLAIRERQDAIRQAMEEAARVADAQRRPSQPAQQRSMSVSAFLKGRSASTSSIGRKLSITRLKAKYYNRADRAATKAAIRDAKEYQARQAREDAANREFPRPQVQRQMREEQAVMEWERDVRRERDEREERSQKMTMENIHSYPVPVSQQHEYPRQQHSHNYNHDEYARRPSDAEDEWQDVPSSEEADLIWENEMRREREEREARSRQMSFESMHSSNVQVRGRSKSRVRNLSASSGAGNMLADINEVNTPGLNAWNKAQDASLRTDDRKESVSVPVVHEEDEPKDDEQGRGRSSSKSSVPNWRDDPRSRSRSNSYAPRAKLRPTSTRGRSRSRTRARKGSTSSGSGRTKEDKELTSASITHAADIPFMPVALDIESDEDRGRSRRKPSAIDEQSYTLHGQSQSQPPSTQHQHGCPMHAPPQQCSQSHSHIRADFPGSLRGRAPEPVPEETYAPRYRQASADPILQRSSFKAGPLPPLPATVPLAPQDERRPSTASTSDVPPWERATVPKGPTVRPVLHKASISSSTLPEEAFSPRAFPHGTDWAYDMTHPSQKGRSASEPAVHYRPSLAQNSRKGSLAGILDRFGYNSRNGSVSKSAVPTSTQRPSISAASGRSDSVSSHVRAQSRQDSIFSLALYDRRPSETSVMSAYRESNSFAPQSRKPSAASELNSFAAHSRKPSAASEYVNVYAQLDAEVEAWDASHPSSTDKGHARSGSSSSQGSGKGFGFEFGDFHVARIEEGRKAQEKKDKASGPFRKESVTSWL